MTWAKLNVTIGWVLTAAVALIMWLSGAGKLMNSPAAIAEFEHWGYSRLFMYTIGTLEVLAGLFLLVPRTALFGAGLIVILMLGAAATHIMYDSSAQLLRPFFVVLFVVLIVRIRRSLYVHVKPEDAANVTLDT